MAKNSLLFFSLRLSLNPLLSKESQFWWLAWPVVDVSYWDFQGWVVGIFATPIRPPIILLWSPWPYSVEAQATLWTVPHGKVPRPPSTTTTILSALQLNHLRSRILVPLEMPQWCHIKPPPPSLAQRIDLWANKWLLLCQAASFWHGLLYTNR